MSSDASFTRCGILFSSTTIAAGGCETGALAGIGRWLPKIAAGKMMRLSGMFVQSS
jgi:hypothetical protein